MLFRYTLLIAFGCYLAIGNSKINKKTSFVMVVAGITYIIVFCYLGFTPPVTNYWTGTCIWACLPIMPISIPLLKSEKLKNSAVEFLGKASYDIFLVQMVYYNGADIVYKMVDNRALQLLINIIICVSVGLVFYFVEKPVTKFVAQKLNLSV